MEREVTCECGAVAVDDECQYPCSAERTDQMTTTRTHAEWWLDQFNAGTTGLQGLYAGADIVQYGPDDDVLLYVDGSRLTIPFDGEAVAS